MKELPDRWLTRLSKAARPHGRFAVISSCATAGVLLVLGGVVLASQSARDVTNISSPPKSAVSSTADGSSGTLPFNPSSTVTTTTILGAAPTASPDSGTQRPIITNTTVVGVPATNPRTGATIPTTVPLTTPASTVVAGVTTTTVKVRAVNGAQIPTVDADVSYSADDPVVNLKITAGDKDGYVSRVVINWNDQTPWTVVDYALASCIEPLSSQVTPAAMHTYTTAGSYTVTVTVSSVNCVGDGEQQSITTKPVSVGGSEPTTTTTTSTTTPTTITNP